MQLTFTKTGKKHTWVRGVRRDGSEVSFAWPDTGGIPPHDLVHGVIEQVFELRGEAREELRAWTERWLALLPGESLTIAFEPVPAKEARRARAPSAGPA